jgi:glutamate N-acetyltransferase/amino-acid N-acetyltransferase
MTISPLAPKNFPNMPNVPGISIATAHSGMRYENRDDLCLIIMEDETRVAGVFTKSLCASAPVDWCKENLQYGNGRALICNAGNANAFTGAKGEQIAQESATVLSDILSIPKDHIYLASTGVIGEAFESIELTRHFNQMVESLEVSGSVSWKRAAEAITTTDTFPKGSAVKVKGTDAVVVGIAKGSGMIAPDMATMLAFIFTDIKISHDDLQKVVQETANNSFNCITVDSDTSTSDSVLVFATGKSQYDWDENSEAFASALQLVFKDLAHQIVKDGEGATKFVEIEVTGAETTHAAKNIAMSIANSPLVKTAIAAEDANWGRIVMAIGKSGEKANRDLLRIWIGDELVAENGQQNPSYSEKKATQHLQNDNVKIRADIGVGASQASVWTCDLTERYIEINAGYRS